MNSQTIVKNENINVKEDYWKQWKEEAISNWLKQETNYLKSEHDSNNNEELLLDRIWPNDLKQEANLNEEGDELNNSSQMTVNQAANSFGFSEDNSSSHLLSFDVMSNHHRLSSDSKELRQSLQYDSKSSELIEHQSNTFTSVEFSNAERDESKNRAQNNSESLHADLSMQIKEEILEKQHEEKMSELDRYLISKAEESAVDSQNVKANKINSGLFIPNPVHLSYKSFIIKVQDDWENARKCRKEANKCKYYLGVQSDINWITMTPDFEDYIQWILYVKDRFSLENHIQKLSVKRGFKLIAVNDKGVTKRDFKCFRSEGNYQSTNCPFELRYRKLVIEGNENETRYYLAYFRAIHNHPLEIEISSEITNSDKDPLLIFDDATWLQPENVENYFEMISKIYRKEVSNLPPALRAKKRNFKFQSKFGSKQNCKSDKETFNSDEIDLKIYGAVKLLKQTYRDNLEEYFEAEYKQTVPFELISKWNSDPLIRDYSKFDFDCKYSVISLPVEENDDLKEATFTIEQNNSNTVDIDGSKTITISPENAFLDQIDQDQSDDYSLS